MQVRRATVAIGVAALTAACAGGESITQVRDPIRAVMSADALMFVSFDTDGNLSITREELEAGIPREWSRSDANGDGNLSPIEFQNWSNLVLGGSQMGPYRLDFDRNVDNAITREEFETEVRGRFSDYDEDSSGALSRSEFVRLLGQARAPTPRRPPGTL